MRCVKVMRAATISANSATWMAMTHGCFANSAFEKNRPAIPTAIATRVAADNARSTDEDYRSRLAGSTRNARRAKIQQAAWATTVTPAAVRTMPTAPPAESRTAVPRARPWPRAPMVKG